MPAEERRKAFTESFQARDFVAAERLAREALAGIGDPREIDAVRFRTAIAVCRGLTGHVEEAAEALAAEAAVADDHSRRGMVADGFVRIGRSAEALALYEAMLADGVRDPRIVRAAGTMLLQLGRPTEAEAYLREALDRAMGRDLAEARVAPLLMPDSSIALDRFLDRAVTQATHEPKIRIALAMALLAQGKWTEAWPFYEGRSAVTETSPDLPYPRWRHDIAPGRALLFHTEQGAGDIIMFARFAVLLGTLGQTVMLMAPRKLKALLKTLPGIAEVLDLSQRIAKAEVAWAPLGALPGLLQLMPESVPPMQPYLSAEPERVAKWRDWLPATGLRVGIAWQGNPRNAIDIGRSIPLAAFAPLAAVPDVKLVALQKGDGEEQIATCGFAERILRPSPDFDEGPDAFLDTAALMMSLDLVVTSDTSIAHLAGALGQPCFLALKKYPEWRWGMEGETTPWYPSMRLFRQERDGDWDEVFERIAEAVRERARVDQS